MNSPPSSSARAERKRWREGRWRRFFSCRTGGRPGGLWSRLRTSRGGSVRAEVLGAGLLPDCVGDAGGKCGGDRVGLVGYGGGEVSGGGQDGGAVGDQGVGVLAGGGAVGVDGGEGGGVADAFGPDDGFGGGGVDAVVDVAVGVYADLFGGAFVGVVLDADDAGAGLGLDDDVVGHGDGADVPGHPGVRDGASGVEVVGVFGVGGVSVVLGDPDGAGVAAEGVVPDLDVLGVVDLDRVAGVVEESVVGDGGGRGQLQGDGVL